VREPLMSVVVPSFGHAAHVEEALRSVAAQEGPSLECIVIDDASRDESVEIVTRLFDDPSFAERFEGRLRLEVHASNQGAHAALNRGLELARGDWIALLNSDDAFAPGRVGALLEALTGSGSELAFSRVVFVDEHSRLCPSSAESFRLRRHQDVIDRFPTVGFASLRGNAAVSTGNLVFSRRLYGAIGPFAPLRYCHDWDFLLRALVRTEPLYVPRPLYRYRLHATNSFRALEGEADAETEQVLRRYFAALRGGELENESAPSPEGWPGFFERFLGVHGFWRHWQEA
jgi:glycosyltransferase involved in cell wall biosynthesis